MTSSPQRAEQYSGGPSRWPLVIVALLVAQLASLWAVTFVPTQDGPVHLEIAAQLAAVRDGTPDVIDRYYELNPRPEPNWLVYPLLQALARCGGWRVAEKVTLSLYLLTLPWALAYALAAVRRESAFLAVFALPLGPNYLFHMGFLNFSLSVPLGLVALGYGLRLRPVDRRLRYAVLAVLLLGTCLAHAVSASAVAVVLCAAGAWRGAAEATGGRATRLAGALRGLLRPLAAALPTLVLIGSFVAGPSHHALSWQSPLDLLRRLLCLHIMVSFDRIELAPALACAVALAVLAARRLIAGRSLPAASRGDELLAGIALLAALYFALPASLAGGGFLNPRLQLWLTLLGIVWLGCQPWRNAERRAILSAVAVIAVVLLAMHARAYRRLSGYLEEYVSVEPALAAGSTVLPLSFADRDDLLLDRALAGYKVRPFEHALGYIAARRPIVNLAEYQADQGYFPIRYREELDPYRVLVPEEGLVEDALARIDWQAYEKRGGHVDQVLLWGRAASAPWPGQDAFLDRLERDYERVFTSQPRGLAELYRRRPASR